MSTFLVLEFSYKIPLIFPKNIGLVPTPRIQVHVNITFYRGFLQLEMVSKPLVFSAILVIFYFDLPRKYLRPSYRSNKVSIIFYFWYYCNSIYILCGTSHVTCLRGTNITYKAPYVHHYPASVSYIYQSILKKATSKNQVLDIKIDLKFVQNATDYCTKIKWTKAHIL